ncbi:hypothetical protein D3C72_2583150 [compost metagenome]
MRTSSGRLNGQQPLPRITSLILLITMLPLAPGPSTPKIFTEWALLLCCQETTWAFIP